MATVYEILGQVAPSATTNTTLYTVPAATSAVCSTLSICNRASTNSTFRVAVRPAGATLANQHYIVYDSYVNANDSVFLTVGISLGPADVITVYSSTANLSFSLFGAEVPVSVVI